MDLYQILMRDHRLTEQIFSDFEKTMAAEVRCRERLFENLRKGLEAHRRIFSQRIDEKYASIFRNMVRRRRVN